MVIAVTNNNGKDPSYKKRDAWDFQGTAEERHALLT